MSQVNITLNTNTVDINTTNNQIVVNDPSNNIVNVVQPVTTVVEVITLGPQGPPGTSSIADTGSFVTTSSFNAFTSSYNTGSFTGSFTGSLLGTASFATSASLATNSDKIGITDNPSYGGVTYYPTFVGNTSGQSNILVDSSVFTYNPNTNILTTTASFAVSSSFATTASFAVSASYAPNYIEKSVGPTYTTNAILTVTQAEYDAIDPKDSTTLYFII